MLHRKKVNSFWVEVFFHKMATAQVSRKFPVVDRNATFVPVPPQTDFILSNVFGKNPEEVQFCNVIDPASNKPMEFKFGGLMHSLDIKARAKGGLGANIEPNVRTKRAFKGIEDLVNKSTEGSDMEVIPIMFNNNWYPALSHDGQDWTFLTTPFSFPSDKEFPGRQVEFIATVLVVYNYTTKKVWLKLKFSEATFKQ